MSLFLGGVTIDGVYVGGGGGGAAYEQVYTTAGAFTYTVPAGVTRVDVVMVGGGGGSIRGGAGWKDGPGGRAGAWNARTLVVGTDVAAGGTISGVVGAGGTADVGNGVGSGGASSISGAAPLSAAGGAGGGAPTIVGESPGDHTYNGRFYKGGAETQGTNTNGANGNPPGSGASGGNGVLAGFNAAAVGAPGAVWFYAYSGSAGLAQAVYLGTEKVWPPFVPTETTFTTPGTNTYTIPADCKKLDIICIGGGNGGTNGSLAGNGRGGNAGSWVGVTWTRGTNWTTETTLTAFVGGGGVNGAVGTASQVYGTATAIVSGPGGNGVQGITQPAGASPGNFTWNGRSFTGGAVQGNLNQIGNPPGGGGAGGGYNSNGGSGGRGQIWIYAY